MSALRTRPWMCEPCRRGILPGNISVIAIDGPVAAGKTVVGLALARRLGFRYLDTGIMYRAVAWLALQHADSAEAEANHRVPAGQSVQSAMDYNPGGVLSMDDEEWLGALASLNPVTLDGDDSDRVKVGSFSVGPELRRPEVDRLASIVSQVSRVRQALVEQQRVIASEGRIVMAGRDIGSVVLPNADLKIFISASLEERARRRHAEQVARGVNSTLEQVVEETRTRDDRDTQREDSPLVQAPDSWVICTDHLSVDDVVDMVLDRVGQLSHSNANPQRPCQSAGRLWGPPPEGRTG